MNSPFHVHIHPFRRARVKDGRWDTEGLIRPATEAEARQAVQDCGYPRRIATAERTGWFFAFYRGQEPEEVRAWLEREKE